MPLPASLDNAGKIDSASAQKQIKAVKDFESVFITQLLETMEATIGDWGMEKDGASGQIQDMFWSFLGDEVSDQGGLGLWKNIYKTMGTGDEKTNNAEKLETQA